MNQAFKHNFNTQKEDIIKPDTDGMNNDVYTEAGHARNICFVWQDGKRIFLNYSYLICGEYLPEESIITLSFTSHLFILKGINLEVLFYDFMQQFVRHITCIDARYNLLGEGQKPIVNEIQMKKEESL